MQPIRESQPIETPMPSPQQETFTPTKVQSAQNAPPIGKQAGQTTLPPSRPIVSEQSHSAGETKRVLRPIRQWMEVVERMMRSSPQEASFVKPAKAYTVEGSDMVVVRFDNAFAISMMERDDARDHLRAAISSVLRREVGDRALVMEVAGKTDAPSVLDEILDET